MIGGLRLLPTRPALAGVLFGLLTYKPQLGVLVPVALRRDGRLARHRRRGRDRSRRRRASSFVYGFSLWGLWLHSIFEYATRFHPVVGYMPTIYANAIMLGAWRSVAWGLQLVVVDPRRRSSSGGPFAQGPAIARRRCWSSAPFWRRRTPSTTTCR